MKGDGKDQAKSFVQMAWDCLEAADQIACQLIDPGPDRIEVPERVTRHRVKHFIGYPLEGVPLAEMFMHHLEDRARTLAILAESVKYLDGPW